MRIFQTAAVSLCAFATIGCAERVTPTVHGGVDIDTIYADVATRTRAEMAFDSSVRVARLLETCGTPECMASRTKIESIGSRLIQHVNTRPGPNWFSQENALLDEYSAAKREAYLVLVDSGWVAPAGTDGTGSWDATWWDFSSP